ncbi:polyketide cyclase / dehydrase and lipid transport [Microlunatus speluncae]|uniref:polyketide cyclase / dehydrase and lipid transport n=1 Tax=Microlunatus speluncae TaxID=2594267 RepID=UPI00126682A2|nr:polyketide cyclase / dehydrase and lipid transport [Microlunatus speluncae]
MTTGMTVVEAELFIRSEPARIAAVLADPDWQAGWAHGLIIQPYADRGAEGLRAVLTGALTGSCEWWIEAVPPTAGADGARGAVVHFWLRPVEPEGGWWRLGPGWRRRAELHRRHLARRWRAALFRLKDALERPDGTSSPARIPAAR